MNTARRGDARGWIGAAFALSLSLLSRPAGAVLVEEDVMSSTPVVADTQELEPGGATTGSSTAGTEALPEDHSESEADLRITRRIRQALAAEGTGLTAPDNVKIVTRDGNVTLQG